LLRTDHSSLTWLQNFKEPEGVVARWISCLDTYDFRVEHRKGKAHQNADALSRAPCRKCKRTDYPDCELTEKCQESSGIKTTAISSRPTEQNLFTASVTVESNWIDQWDNQRLLELQENDKDIQYVRKHKMNNPDKPDVKIANQSVS
jgi:hypothetical protein